MEGGHWSRVGGALRGAEVRIDEVEECTTGKGFAAAPRDRKMGTADVNLAYRFK